MKIDITATTEVLSGEITKLDAAIEKNHDQALRLDDVLVDPRCSSQSYSAIAQRIRELRIPVIQTHLVAFEALQGANVQNMAALSSLPTTSPGVLDTDKCDEMIREIEDHSRQISESYAKIQRAEKPSVAALNSYQRLLDMNASMIRQIQEKKEAALEYDAYSSTLYADAESTFASILKGATSSVNTYLATGQYGDTSWKVDLETAYELALVKQYDRAQMQLSLENEDELFLSYDCSKLYYRGMEWVIVGGEAYEVEEDRGVVMRAGWSLFDRKSFPYSEFNWGKFLSGVNLSEDGIPKQSHKVEEGNKRAQPIPYSQKGLTRMQRGLNAMDITDQAIKSFEKYKIDFVFETNGIGGQRVTIYGKKDYPTNNALLLSQCSFWSPAGHAAAKNMYIERNGGSVPFDIETRFDVVCVFDEAREAENAYSSVFYFNEEQQMRERAIQYPDDRIEIILDGGLSDSIDITDEFFLDAEGKARGYFSEKIDEELKRKESE